MLDEEEQQNSAAAAGLGLAVMSSLCRVQDIACAEEVLDKVPLVIKVQSPLQPSPHCKHQTCKQTCRDLRGLQHCWPHHAVSLEYLQE